MRIKRDFYLNDLISRKHNHMIKIVTGMRRCGKSYLLFELFYEHLKSVGITDSHIIKIDLEDRRNQLLYDPDALLSYIDSHITDNDMHYILIDEIQYVKEFESVLNSYLHRDNADLYVTGSNSKFLSTDIITEFRGRGDEVRVHPLSFREFLSVYEGADRHEAALLEYMTYGGLPQVVVTKDIGQKEHYLKTLFETTYLKDIKERYKIADDSNLEEFISVLASSIGSLTNPLNIQKSFRSVKGSSISADTIKRYLDYLQNAFIVNKALRYDVKGKRYINTPSKYYFEDLGLRNALLNFRQFDEGHLMENLIYNELLMRGFSVDVGDVTYNCKDEEKRSIRKNLEVDFVCNRGYRRIYIQSAFRIGDDEKMENEKRPLLQINDNFQKMVIVGDWIATYQNVEGIVIMNIFDFLMGEEIKWF